MIGDFHIRVDRVDGGGKQVYTMITFVWKPALGLVSLVTY